MNKKHIIAGIFILCAIADMGSFILLTNLKEDLDKFEINPIYRVLGFAPLILTSIAIHGTIIYYLYKPFFRGKHFNYEISYVIVLIAVAHLYGATMNTYSYIKYVPPTIVNGVKVAAMPAPTSAQMNALIIITMLPFVVIVLVLEAVFYVYDSLDSVHHFDDSNESIELAKKSRLAYGIWHMFLGLISVGLYSLIGRVAIWLIAKFIPSIGSDLAYGAATIFGGCYGIVHIYKIYLKDRAPATSAN